MNLVVKESGLRQLEVAFRRLEGTVQDLRPVWPAVSDYFHRFERAHFSTEGGSGASGKWKALSARYAEWKSLRFPGKGILELTGALKASLTGGAGSRSVSERLRYTEESLVPYARYHATGTGTMPQRSPVSITEAQAREIGALVGRHVQKDIRKHFQTVGAA